VSARRSVEVFETQARMLHERGETSRCKADGFVVGAIGIGIVHVARAVDIRIVQGWIVPVGE
jgi:hypothetical protein